MFIIVLLFFLVNFVASYDISVFSYRQNFTLKNKYAMELVDFDVPLTVNTYDLKRFKNIYNCSYLRFDHKGSLLKFFVEGECGEQTETIIWVRVPSLEASKSVNITMLSGCLDWEDIPSAGAPIDWTGEFLAMTSTSCSSPWSSVAVTKNRFIKITPAYNPVQQDASNNMATHKHNFNYNSGLPDQEQESETGVCSDGTDTVSLATHSHTTSPLSVEAQPTGLPPFYSLKLCESRSLRLLEDYIVAFNSTDYSDGKVTQFTELGERFPVISNDAVGTIGGAKSHVHWGTYKTDEFAADPDAGDKIVMQGSNTMWDLVVHNHIHHYQYNTSRVDNSPTGFEIPFVKVLAENSESLPYLFFAKEVPPRGFIQTSREGFIRGGNVVKGVEPSTTAHSPENVRIDDADTGGQARACTAGGNNYCATLGHTHGSASGSIPTGTWDTDDQDRLELIAIIKKDVPVDISAAEPVVACSMDCGSHGSCASKTECGCHKYWTGGLCDVGTCAGYLLNITYPVGDKCSGHGSCDNPGPTCTCNNFYYRKDCDVFYCGGGFSNNTGSQCTGRGNCTSGGEKCVCIGDYHGDNCELDGPAPPPTTSTTILYSGVVGVGGLFGLVGLLMVLIL